MIKKGTRVRIEGNGEYECGGFDGRIGIALEDSNMPWVKLDTGIVKPIEEQYLTPVEPSIDNLMVGDRIKRKTGDDCKVIFIGNDDYICTSESGDFGTTSETWTKRELKENDYEVISPSPKTTLTKKEIAAKFGIEEDNMEIK